MVAFHRVLTIAIGTTTSNTIGRDVLERAMDLGIFAPNTLPETVTVEVAADEALTEWRDLQSAGADVVLTAGKCTVVPESPFFGLRLSAGVAVAAERTFTIIGSHGN